MTVRCIDMRLRPPIPEWVSGPTFKTAMYYPRQVNGFKGARSAWLESMELLFDEMDTSGVRYGVVMGRASSGQLGGVGNQAIVTTLQRWPDRFVGFLGIDLENIGPALQETQRLVREPGVVGISIEPGSSRTPRLADDPALTPIYEACLDWQLPVSISLSGLLSSLAGHDLSWCSPIPVQRVAMRYPELKIIVSHAAWPWADQMVSIALICHNIYVSPDLYIATANMPCARSYVDAANCYLSDRTLFGTAYPTRPLDECVRDFLGMGFNPAIVDKILYGNAARLLGLPA
ncbi:MAG TPA: amidohydrolase family protein [Casimicrobiaceae bacterium]|nr:amidohydrolase family protein [Casimicrobiaceae bacterium]